MNTQCMRCFVGSARTGGKSSSKMHSLFTRIETSPLKWVAQVPLFDKLAFRSQVEGGRNPLLGLIPFTNCRVPHAATAGKASVLPAVSAPILRALCEGWDDQIFPINLPRKKTCSSEAWVSQDTMVVAENPGLKSGTWATHWVSF